MLVLSPRSTPKKRIETMSIYVAEKIQKEYEDAVAKLKADKYEDKIPPKEKEKLEEAVLRKLLIDYYTDIIEELNEGKSPYDYGDVDNVSLDRALK